mgnify:CR=1 FL=1
MSEEAAGYQAYAQHLGKLRRVVGGSATALATVAPAGYYDVSGGDDPDESAETYLRDAGWHRAEDEYTYPRELQTSGACIADLERKVTALEHLARIHGAAIEDLQAALALALSEAAALRDQVRELQLERCAERGEL